MLIISSAELRQNMKKYLDIAKTEEVIIQRGNAETFVLSGQAYLRADEDLARAVTMDELRAGVRDDIKEIYRTIR